MTKRGAAASLRGAAAVVTGGGSGVGRAVCELLALAQARILLVGRDEAKLRRACAELPTETLFVAGDVGDSKVCDRAVATAARRWGRIDLLVNSAGIIKRGSAARTSDAAWAAVMRANVDGVFFASRAAARRMAAQKPRGGAIVNVASTLAVVGAPGLAAYCASKGAVAQLTRAMALEGAPDNIRVNAVCPGAIDSPMLFSEHPRGVSAAAVRARNIDLIPQKALAAAEEVARAILFLAVEPHITGALLSVDGGYVAQ